MASLRQKKVNPEAMLLILHYTDPALLSSGETLRSVPTLGTGIEQEEEREAHLRDALESGAIIPTREVQLSVASQRKQSSSRSLGAERRLNENFDQYLKWHAPSSGDVWRPKAEVEYDADEADVHWLSNFLVEHPEVQFSLDKFEELMCTMERECRGVQTVSLEHVTFHAPQVVLDAVYEYWAEKRKKRPLFARYEGVPSREDKRWWVPFRPRDKNVVEKKRRHMKQSFEAMNILRNDMERVRVILVGMKRREQSKLELLRVVSDQMEVRAKLLEKQADQMYMTMAASVSSSSSSKRKKTWLGSGGRGADGGGGGDRERLRQRVSDMSDSDGSDTDSASESARIVMIPKYIREPGLIARSREQHTPLFSRSPFDDLVVSANNILHIFVEKEKDKDATDIDIDKDKKECEYSGGSSNSVSHRQPYPHPYPQPYPRRRFAFGIRGRIGRGGRYVIDRPRVVIPASSHAQPHTQSSVVGGGDNNTTYVFPNPDPPLPPTNPNPVPLNRTIPQVKVGGTRISLKIGESGPKLMSIT